MFLEIQCCYCVTWWFSRSLFKLLNSIQLYEYNNCLFTTDRHLGSFRGLRIMNKAAMNTLLQGPCGQTLSFFSGEYPEMELLGHGGKCVFSDSLYTPSRGVWEFHLLYVLTTAWLCQSFELQSCQ